MAEPEKQQIGDGSDNYGQAAGQMAKAANDKMKKPENDPWAVK